MFYFFTGSLIGSNEPISPRNVIWNPVNAKKNTIGVDKKYRLATFADFYIR